MNNLIDIYTKLILKIGNEIIVTYYTNDGIKHTKESLLLEVRKFSYILIGNNQEILELPFISENILIESITFKKEKSPIYLNPYIKESTNPFLYYDFISNSMNQIFLDYQDLLQKREKRIKKYIAKYETVTLEKLFFTEKQEQEFKLFFNTLITELSNFAIKKGLDPSLKEICSGTTSIIYEIGDKIIKIGKPRRTPVIPYCEYILQPIINRIFEFDGYPIHIEVTQKVFTLDNKDGYACESEDERFQEIVSILNKELYAIGLSSRDLHPGNVGILLEDNKIHFDEITFDTSDDETTSIENNNNLKILKKGRYVIIDLDSLEIEDEEKYCNYLKSIGYKKKIKTYVPTYK